MKLLNLLIVVSVALGLVSGCAGLLPGAQAVSQGLDPTKPVGPGNPSALTSAVDSVLHAATAVSAAQAHPTPENTSQATYGIGAALAALVGVASVFFKARSTQNQVDELYDRTHAAVSIVAKPG